MKFRVQSKTDDNFNEDDGNIDTLIVNAPNEVYVNRQERVLHAEAVRTLTHELAEGAASSQGRELHHAEFVFTDDPKVVRELVHKCPACVAGADQATAYLENSDAEVIVGTIWYVPTP